MDTEEQVTNITEAQIREIIRDELEKATNMRVQADRTIIEKHLQILDAHNIQVGRANGTMIGTATDQKLGFLGATPVGRAASIAGPSGGGGGATNAIDVDGRRATNAIIAAIKAIGITN